MNDTIAAISTATGGSISIIRVSGTDSIKIVNKIFKGKDLLNVNSHTIHYGYIVESNKIIDEVLVSVMKEPNTYTKENVVEINSHGSIASVSKILELLIENGCRLAEPGEFTKRAFLNGRIDLLEAESVMDIINSKTEKSLSLAVRQLTGSATKLISDLREEILTLLASIEVKIDYPEYEDIEDVTHNELLENINTIEIKMKKILEESKNAKIIKDGINTSIIGKPNVGKSSILNKLIADNKELKRDKTIKNLKALAKTQNTKEVINWHGGGGFQVAHLSPQCFDYDLKWNRVILTEHAKGDILIRSIAANLGFSLLKREDVSIFDGRKGNSLLKVIEGVVTVEIVDWLVPQTKCGEIIVIAAMSVMDGVRQYLRQVRKGSKIIVIPDDIFQHSKGGNE